MLAISHFPPVGFRDQDVSFTPWDSRFEVPGLKFRA